MKCDELKAYKGDVTIPVYGTIADAQVCLKKDVDAAIAELKVKLDEAIAERDGNQVCIDALKQKLEDVQAGAYSESVDAGMRERRLKRVLWLARAERAKTEHLSKIMYSTLYRDFIAKWVNVERKCREKVEEYR